MGDRLDEYCELIPKLLDELRWHQSHAKKIGHKNLLASMTGLIRDYERIFDDRSPDELEIEASEFLYDQLVLLHEETEATIH